MLRFLVTPCAHFEIKRSVSKNSVEVSHHHTSRISSIRTLRTINKNATPSKINEFIRKIRRPSWCEIEAEWCTLCHEPVHDIPGHRAEREHRARELIFDHLVAMPIEIRRWIPASLLSFPHRHIFTQQASCTERSVAQEHFFLDENVRRARIHHALTVIYDGQGTYAEYFGSSNRGSLALRYGSTAVRYLCTLILLRTFPCYSSGLLSPILARVVCFENCEGLFDLLRLGDVFPDLHSKMSRNERKNVLKCIVGDLWQLCTDRRCWSHPESRRDAMSSSLIPSSPVQAYIDYALWGLLCEILIHRFSTWLVDIETVWNKWAGGQVLVPTRLDSMFDYSMQYTNKPMNSHVRRSGTQDFSDTFKSVYANKEGIKERITTIGYDLDDGKARARDQFLLQGSFPNVFSCE